MTSPRFAPTPVVDTTRSYSSPPTVARPWMPDRKAEVEGFQPQGEQLGFQGPDQGFALTIAEGFRARLQLHEGEHADDAIRGCLGIALRRASLFSRAPVVHDLTIAFTMWGFLGGASAEVVDARRTLFAGLAHPHHYTEARALVDMVPEATLRMTPAQVTASFPAQWRTLVGI